MRQAKPVNERAVNLNIQQQSMVRVEQFWHFKELKNHDTTSQSYSSLSNQTKPVFRYAKNRGRLEVSVCLRIHLLMSRTLQKAQSPTSNLAC